MSATLEAYEDHALGWRLEFGGAILMVYECKASERAEPSEFEGMDMSHHDGLVFEDGNT